MSEGVRDWLNKDGGKVFGDLEKETGAGRAPEVAQASDEGAMEQDPPATDVSIQRPKGDAEGPIAKSGGPALNGHKVGATASDIYVALATARIERPRTSTHEPSSHASSRRT